MTKDCVQWRALLSGERNGTPNQRETPVVPGKPLKQERTGTEPATPKQERDPYRRWTLR